MGPQNWASPFLRQCFVTAGVSLNMSGSGLVMGFSVGLLKQLQRPDSSIPIDDSSGSWIAALPGISLIFGNFAAPSIMEKYGRKMANIISILFLISGWICVIFSTSVPWLLTARLLQGLCMGISTSLASLLIGEYTSPKNRGAFLMTIAVSISIGVLFIHLFASYFSWQIAAAVCAGVAFVDLLMVLFSPESPSWLADQGRYEDCKRVFRWLRGEVEETELTKMIEASIITNELKLEANKPTSFVDQLKSNIAYFNTTIIKREFYRPILIMVHIYLIAQWSGVNVMVAYTADIFAALVGEDANIPLLVVTLDLHRTIASIFAIYIIKNVKRRKMFLTTVGINIAALLATAAYSFAKQNQSLPMDHPLIGVMLTHCLMFAVATGTLSLCFIIAGEIFPLEFKNLASAVSVFFYSGNMFISVKTVPYFFKNIGVHGTYCLYATVLGYCMFVTWIMLPETKDRTLQEIEDEFRGRPMTGQELKSVQSLASWKAHNADRRCSTPAIA